MTQNPFGIFMRLMATTALVAIPSLGATEDCALLSGCDGDIAVTVPLGANTERPRDIPDLASDGFSIAVDGAPVAQDGTVLQGQVAGSTQRRQDIALSDNNVSVQFDGFEVKPRLTLQAVNAGRRIAPGSSVVLENQMNYPAFVSRGEVRVIDLNARGGARVVQTLPVDPNGRVTVKAPAARENLAYVYRVYDARGRFDETQALSLGSLPSATATRDDGAVEDGTDSTAIHRIPVFGGAVTVSGNGVGAGRKVSTLGETVVADGQGRFVLQRILPTGEHLVGVNVANGPVLAREIDIPASDLFYIGIVDVTIGKSLKDDLRDATGEPYDDTYQRGRVAFYLKGKIKGDALLTAALDTGEDDLGNIFSNLDEKNPRSLIDRIDPDEFYPVYGDDSASVNDAPTAGKLYVKLERDDDHILWGTFKSALNETEYLRNERTLYGAQGVWRSAQQTASGEARFEAQAYAAQPETLPQRDSFLGTGGSVYFLKFQDVTRGSETVQVEIRDPDTGRVLGRQTLVYGTDYDINYVQGLVTLRRPLSGTASTGGLVVTNPSGDDTVNLVVTYEHTPTVSDVDSFSYGGRLQGWVNDEVRLGVTVQKEDLGTTDQKSYGADLLYRHSDRTWMTLEYARTDGQGLSQDSSVDAGLTLDTQAGIAGDGRAYKLEAQADLQELGLGLNGLIGGYFEDRSAGFSTLSYRSANDERLYGLYLELDPSEEWSVRFEFDHYNDSAGKKLREGELVASYHYSDRIKLQFGVVHIDEIRPGFAQDTGSRTDVAVRADIDHSERLSWYGYAQGTLARSGGLDRNNRIGVGAIYRFNEAWTGTAEISEGSRGFGALAKLSYADEAGNTHYFGYTLDPDRRFDNLTLNGRDRGRLVAGARRQVHDKLVLTGENSYDLFGQRKALTSAYGAEYAATEAMTFDAALEIGQVRDPVDLTRFDRTALSFGATYKSDDLTWRGRLEYRQDKGLSAGSNRDADTIAGSFTARYKFAEDARLLFSVDGVQSVNATASIPDAEFFELTLGYAFRPVANDRLNVLAKYQYIYDMTERAATVPSAGANFLTSPRQKAHIFSVDAAYDLTPNWTLGGKIGGRLSEQDSAVGFFENDATLGVLNLRYHAIHKWDFLLEARQLNAKDLGTETGLLVGIYRHFGNNLKIGVGYNDSSFSDDLADVTYNERGLFLNVIGKF